ncbi:MAG: hypothetical protein LBG80_10730 [Bacteroidales bacterium]|nr:hypothetical protein [Bacteroidales bacterium]
MENTEKIRKQFHSLGSGIIIKLGGWLLGLIAVIVLIQAFGASISTAVGIWLGYKVLRLVMRLFGLLLSLVFTLVSIFILIGIISLLIF